MTLAQKQQRFAVCLAQLILFVDSKGWAVTLGEVYRSPQEAARLATEGAGISQSLHTQRLAADLNLFVGGVYQQTTEAYTPLGLFWESLSTPAAVCRWGGRFTKPDGNHFSIGHDGRA